MSNQASLFAENTPDPYDPDRKPRAKDKTVFIAGAAYQVPAFWLCCFDKSDIAPVEWQNYEIPQLVSEMAPLRSRLAERAALVKELSRATLPPGRTSEAPLRRRTASTSNLMVRRYGVSFQTRARSGNCSTRR